MSPQELAAIAARCEQILNPTVRMNPKGLLPDGGPHLVKLSGDEWDFYIAAQKDIPALVREVERLRGLVEAAYREGYDDGLAGACGVEMCFTMSDAKRLLDKGE